MEPPLHPRPRRLPRARVRPAAVPRRPLPLFGRFVRTRLLRIVLAGLSAAAALVGACRTRLPTLRCPGVDPPPPSIALLCSLRSARFLLRREAEGACIAAELGRRQRPLAEARRGGLRLCERGVCVGGAGCGRTSSGRRRSASTTCGATRTSSSSTPVRAPTTPPIPQPQPLPDNDPDPHMSPFTAPFAMMDTLLRDERVARILAQTPAQSVICRWT